MKTVAIYGLGLIGGSFGLALRKAGFPGEILGLCAPPFVEKALAMGAITRQCDSLAVAAQEADVIFLSHRIDAIIHALGILGPIARAGCLITDSGSTKTAIVNKATECVNLAEFIGGHPLAGREKRGVEAADPDLFRGKPYVLTGFSSLSKEFENWLERIGANVVHMTAEEHDRVVAYTSHLPQILSTALSLTLARQDNKALSQVFGPGLTDMTRLALSSSELWQDILRTNKDSVQTAIDSFIETLGEVRSAIENDGVEPTFTEAGEFARKLRHTIGQSSVP